MDIKRLFKRKTQKCDCFEIDVLSASDAELIDISNTMGLALALPEMKNIQAYFTDKNRLPTDIELQALGQAWSEHCCYKSSKIPLKKYVFGIAEDKIIAREDAGVAEFDEDHYYCAALESHNHPSAVEPYGGAATGVGGIVRDVVCMGAQPIAYIDPLFFGPLDLPQSELPKGVKHPRFLFKGVVDGIRDYGNRIGIPTLSGQVYFHKGYTGNCLVNVGCIGIMKKEELIHSYAKAPGDVYVYVGGKTGRDGIHGVTFASAELKDDSEESSRSAVQVGDPITKEPVIHVTLECNRKGLLEGLKDFGGGGLSCVCGELAYAAGFGAEINLDEVPLKEEGLSPWEIWVSESQERMMFLVSKENVNKVLHICKQWDVTAAVVGQVIEEKITRVLYNGEKILEMDLDFYTGGPVYDTCQRPIMVYTQKEYIDPPLDIPDLNDVLKRLLGSLNIASKEWVVRQYDHEVRANTVIRPLQGKINCEGHGDATVLKPLEKSFRGLAVTANINPRFMERDPYHGACAAIDETCRNLVSVGARPHSLLDCLNFGNPEKPERMGEFYEACRGLGDTARELNLPFMSGNVSFYNESTKTSVPPTPQILGVGIVPDVRKCITSDFKENGNLVYLVGKETKKEMGGSEYYHIMGIDGGIVPKTDINMLQNCINGILTAIEKGQIVSCHDCSEGGLGVCLSEMCIGGDIGLKIDIGDMGKDLRADYKLFSESNTRWVVEVKKENEKDFIHILKENKTPFVKLGETANDTIFIKDNGETIIDLKVKDARDIWRKTLWSYMG
ncbi:MAG: phosphoribosylformylglycinamidine synthase subunit PurL [Candidatus Thermoplasmatota archaeon]|nr:phosphoribosylformylglycinamidine synthase subunit PurL [Candidatus Thermoplasmatota archaeon]